MTSNWRDDLYQRVVEGFHAVDAGLSDRVEPGVTDDFTMTLPGVVVSGERYAEFLQQRAGADYTTRHCVSNFRVVDHGPAATTVGFVITVHRLEPGAAAPVVNVADVVDEWVDTGAGWRHRSRSVTPAFAVAGAV